MRTVIAILSLSLAPAALVASEPNQHDHTALNERGRRVMGFDQTTTTHHFILARDGGRIEVTANDRNDVASIDQIRSHLQHITRMFAAGDFEAPMLVHAKQPPGVDAMKKAGSAIAYAYVEVDRGAHIRITAAPGPGLEGVHEFLRFQIRDHQTGDSPIVR